MTEGHICNHCKKFFAGTPHLKGTAKIPDKDEYVWPFTLCKGCAEFLVPKAST